MAIYHLSMKPVTRAQGRSATAAAAYRAAERINDIATGQTFDYTRRRGVEHTEIILPTVAAMRDVNWARDRAQLWNAAEAAEKRKDARVGREWEIALPAELDRIQRIDLTRDFACEIANRYGCAVDIAIHRPHRSGDQRNHHAHLLATTRTIEVDGLGRKTDIELGDRDRRTKGLAAGAEEVTAMRARWAELANGVLMELGHTARVDHRSFNAQGLDRTPTVHLGPSVVGMERRGVRTGVGERIREERQREQEQRLEKTAELGKLERETAEVQKSIADLSEDLQSANRERGLARIVSTLESGPKVDDLQQRGRERWIASRAGRHAADQKRGADGACVKGLDQALERVLEPIGEARDGRRREQSRELDGFEVE